MLTHRRLREPHVFDEVAHTVLTGSQVLHDRQSRRIGERLEQVRIRGSRGLVESRGIIHINRHTAIISLYGD